MNADIPASLPRLLVIDDFYGRELEGGTNEDRQNLCRLLGLRDLRQPAAGSRQAPIADARFIRGQTPAYAKPGDRVENDLEACLEAVRSGLGDNRQTPRWAMILLDLCFYTGEVTNATHARQPGMPAGRPGDEDPTRYFGLRVLEAIRREFPELPVLILSSMPRADVTRRISELGAAGFLARTDPKARELLRDALWRHGLFADLSGNLLGTSIPLLLALRHARRLAMQDGNILIRGERGSGKELFARLLHAARPGKARAFEVVNSAVFTPELFGSELFGIAPGTATGVSGKPGIVELADGGDLFLDEVADMPPTVQAGVLRVLQDRKVTRVGGRKSRQVDVRFLAASNADLERLVGEERFREDLLDRLREGGTLVVPPLRERLDDMPLLVEAFVRQAEAANPAACRRAVDEATIASLRHHDWPGNLRELRSKVFEAVNSHPDVEFLLPDHMNLGRKSEVSGGLASEDGKELGARESTWSPEILLPMIQGVRWDAARPESWSGCYPELARAFAFCQTGLLRASLEATKRRTPTNPQGDILIHPAVKLITGNRAMTASQAADFIKRLFNISASLRQEILADPTLNDAYQIAKRLRPSTAKVGSNASPKAKHSND